MLVSLPSLLPLQQVTSMQNNAEDPGKGQHPFPATLQLDWLKSHNVKSLHTPFPAQYPPVPHSSGTGRCFGTPFGSHTSAVHGLSSLGGTSLKSFAYTGLPVLSHVGGALQSPGTFSGTSAEFA